MLINDITIHFEKKAAGFHQSPGPQAKYSTGLCLEQGLNYQRAWGTETTPLPPIRDESPL